MARCLLYSHEVDDLAVVCPVCGSSVVDDPTVVVDPSQVGPPHGTPPPQPFGTPPQPFGTPPPPGVDLGKPSGDPSPGPFSVPGPDGPPGPYAAPTAYPPSAPGPPAPFGQPGYPPAPYGQPYGYGAVPWGYQPRPTEGLATAAMITSIAGLAIGFGCFVGWLACPVGAVMGHQARKRIQQTGNQGDGMALAGIICGWVGTGLALVLIVFYFVVFGGLFVLGGTT